MKLAILLFRNRRWGVLGTALAALLTALLFASPLGAAEGPETLSTEQVQQRFAEAQARLDLSPAQTQQLRALMEDHAEILRGIRQQYGATPSRKDQRAMMKQARGVQQEFRGELEKILNAEQLAEWDIMREAWRAQARERRGEKQPAPDQGSG